MTNYVVLKETQEEGPNQRELWEAAGPPVEAVSAEAAVRKAVNDGGGRFVAVPVRSWKPVSVTVETKRTLSFA